MKYTNAILSLFGFYIINTHGVINNELLSNEILNDKLTSLQSKADKFEDRLQNNIDKCLELLKKADRLKDKLEENMNKEEQKKEILAKQKQMFECRLMKPKLCKGNRVCKKKLQQFDNRLSKYVSKWNGTP